MSPHQSLQTVQPDDDLKTNAGGRGFLARPSWRRAGMAVALTVMAAVLPWPSGPASAVHDVDLFELDGNAVDQAADGDDWNNLANADAQVFVVDTFDTGELTAFTGGGSKDDLDIPGNWMHANDPGGMSVPDKDDITNAYAAAYVDPDSGDLNLYFGADRFANNGTATFGFWFFQDDVAPLPDGTFSGAHQVGDVLVVADFNMGGSVTDLDLYVWDGTTAVLETSGVDCATALAGDDVCAAVNAIATPAPWAYTPKSGTAGEFPERSFIEGGINLSDLFPTGQPCFSSFLAETRVSNPLSSVLKDFASGGFEVCGLTVEKDGDRLAKVGDPVNYEITITNDGLVRLFKQDIDDSLLGAITTNGVDQANPAVISNTCDEPFLDPGESCSITLTRVVQADDPDPLVNTVTVLYNTGPGEEFEGTEVETTSSVETVLFEPSVNVTKTGDTLSTVGDPVDYVITVENTSSVDSPDLVNGTITDTLLGNLLDGDNPFVTSSTCTATLAVGASCTIEATRTVSAGDPDPLPNTVTVNYNPDGFTNEITDNASHDVNLFQPSVLVEKSGPAQSKVGDTVTYTIEVTNTSSADTPTLILDSISDPLIGDLDVPADCDALDPGESCEFTADRVVQAGDPNPLVNTVTVVFHADGFTVDVAGTSDSDSHSTDLFVPSVSVEKGGPAEAEVGDTVTYTFKVTNTSSPGSPALILDSISDPLIGTLTIPAACNVLDPGESCNFSATRVVLAGDPDPLVNTVTVHYHPTGFPNDIADSDGHTVNIVSPYNQYPGDNDFDFDTPFDDAGDPGIPAPTGDTAGTNDQTGHQPAPAPQPVVAPGTTNRPEDPAGPVALDQLPRTGQGLDRVTMLGALFLALGGMSVVLGRRRKATQA